MKTKSVLFSLLLVFSFTACKKESNTVPAQFYLTDAPADYQEVNIDLVAIRVKLDKEEDNWVDLKTNAGVYNLLALQNGVSTLIAQGDLPQGVIKEVRLILGPNNSIKANGQTFPLVIPSGEEAGLKIKIDKKLKMTLNSFMIDFDAGLSVKEENSGFKLRPVIKLKG
ncbi:MAG: DUF4382 domain-containing protein [Flavisolibacter sp.]|nr:DUF4382 domain-containing protein [Flavisolibacter sp.]